MEEPARNEETPERPATGGRAPAVSRKLYGTFGGVFTPTLLTILGVIMYLRLPWVVGNGGVLGGGLVVMLAIGITTATGLSLSSIASNTRLGAGGPYAIIAQSLGLEIGGSVGVPLYLSQALAVAMYIFGFREGWNWVFPDHPAMLVDFATFFVVFGVAFVSAGLAFRLQYAVMLVIAASLVVVFGNLDVWTSDQPLVWWGDFRGAPENDFSGATFWVVFAVFFPAATGIMAGANMSGELENPRRSIPTGTLAAIMVSSVVYVGLVIWSAKAASPEDLTASYTVMIDRSMFGPLVVAGLLGATFSSALASLVGAPRILFALASDGLIPGGPRFATLSQSGEPRAAMLLTGAIVLLALLLRNLNAIAPLISMFFLITYAVINLVTFVESSLELASFRPTLRLPRVVPLLGTLGCLFAMFIVNPTFSLVAWGMVLSLYFWILRRRIGRRQGDVRSGIFVALAEWAATRVTELDIAGTRAWKPNFLIPVIDGAELRGEFRMVVELCRPSGTVKLLGIADEVTQADLTPRIANLGLSLRKQRVFATWSVLTASGFSAGTLTGIQALQSAFFRPNVLLLGLPSDPAKHAELRDLLTEACRCGLGVMVLAMHEKAGLGRAAVINLWIRPPDEPDADVASALSRGNMNMGVLMAYRLATSWKAELNLISVVASEADRARTEGFLASLRDLCRIPKEATTIVLVGTVEEAVGRAPQSDLDIMGMSGDRDLASAQRWVRLTRSSCVFTLDSGNESALA